MSGRKSKAMAASNVPPVLRSGGMRGNRTAGILDHPALAGLKTTDKQGKRVYMRYYMRSRRGDENPVFPVGLKISRRKRG